MPDPCHLDNAPITEALIDIQVEPRPGIKSQDLLAVKEESPDDYTIYQDLHQVQATFGVHEDTLTSSHGRQHNGYALTSSDKKWVAQARPQGLTVSRLEPYTEWAELLARTQALWPVYARVASPLAVRRIAVRFINRIEIPVRANLEEHFRLQPDVPAELGVPLTNLLMRVALPFPDDVIAQVTQATEPAVSDRVPILLDIDVFVQQRANPDDEQIWQRLEGLRNVKNKVFFESVTEATLERYK